MAGKVKLTAAQKEILERASETSPYILGRKESATALELHQMGLLTCSTSGISDYYITEEGLAALSQQTGSDNE